MSLSPLNSNRQRRKFEVYDFEWIPRSLRMRLCGRYGEHGYKYYYTVDDFLNDTLTYSNRGKWFFAHAGGLADVQFVFEKLIPKKEFTVEASFSGSSAIIVKVKRSKMQWCFCDSFWLFRDSLANIGKAMGLEKMGPALEISMSEEETRKWYEEVSLEELIPYNQRDCEILYKAIYAFQELLLNEGGLLQKTVASCGMSLFRNKFLNRTIETSKGVNSIARKAYHASRVEVLSHRCVNAKYFDINSSFPFSMTKPQPGNRLQSHLCLPERLIGNPERSYLVRASVTIPEMHIPPIPYREESTNRLFFPCGTWEGWFTDVDFEIMLEEDYQINHVYESKEFDVFHDLAEYSMTIYNKRKQTSDHFMRILYKYLMNAVYGKLAERSEKKKMWINPSPENLTRLDEKYDGFENCYIREGVFLEDVYLPLEHVHVPISARITANSRKILYDLLTTSNRSYYCDTDGFATDDDFPTGNELGELKMEKEIIHGEFYAPKIYSLTTINKDNEEQTIVHAKGFSLGKQNTPEKREEAIRRFRAIVEGKHIAIERMARIRENLRKHIEPTEMIVKKALSENVIPKRFFYPDGESRPWSVEEIKGFSSERLRQN